MSEWVSRKVGLSATPFKRANRINVLTREYHFRNELINDSRNEEKSPKFYEYPGQLQLQTQNWANGIHIRLISFRHPAKVKPQQVIPTRHHFLPTSFGNLKISALITDDWSRESGTCSCLGIEIWDWERNWDLVA